MHVAVLVYVRGVTLYAQGLLPDNRDPRIEY